MSLHNNHSLRAITMNQPATPSKHHHEKPNHTKCWEQKRRNEEAQLSVDPKRRKNYRLIYKRERRKTQCRLPKPEPNAEYQCRALLLAMGAGEANGGRKPPASCPSPPAPNTREATGPNPLSTPNEWWVASGKWQVASGEGWGVICALWLVNDKMSLHEWVYVYESICWLSVSVTLSVFGPIRPEWTGPKQSRPVQSRSRKIGDWSDPGPKISWTGPGLDWTVPVRTGLLLDWWNHCSSPETRAATLWIWWWINNSKGVGGVLFVLLWKSKYGLQYILPVGDFLKTVDFNQKCLDLLQYFKMVPFQDQEPYLKCLYLFSFWTIFT